MPRSIEGIMEAYRAAAARRADGLPNWALKISIGDIWRSEDLTFEQRRDAIVKRIRRTRWPAENSAVEVLLEELADADNPDWFDAVWDLIYDEADADRVWIDR